MTIYFKLLISIFLNIVTVHAEQIYVCTAANSSYFNHLLNLIGSLHNSNFDNLAEIMVFDLGLTAEQIVHIKDIDKITVEQVEKLNAQILKPVQINNWGKQVPGWYSWKPVVIKQALEKYPYVLWLDAGTTVYNSILPLTEYIKTNGYFVCTIGENKENGKFPHDVNWQTTSFIKNLFNLYEPANQHILGNEALAAGIIGVNKFAIDLFIHPMYELSKDIRNYVDDGSSGGGFGCARYEQAILTIICYLKNLTIFKQDYTQTNPIKLKYKDTENDLWITWHADYVQKKTDIYSSRNDLRNFDYFVSAIRHR